MPDELKPCPFCGSEVKCSGNMDGDSVVVTIACDLCSGDGQLYFQLDGGIDKETGNNIQEIMDVYAGLKAELVDLWNTRAP